MNEAATGTKTIVVERELPHAPEKVWRALTQPHLIAEWLMKSDFSPVLGHRFGLHADWGAVACQVEAIEPNRTLAYTWDTKDLRSVVTWSLTPTPAGTRLRLEQTGFRPDQQSYYRGATAGWPRFMASLERVLEGLE
ncbi:MAG: SRPBCC domain-containing protein [Nitratireductor sp.]